MHVLNPSIEMQSAFDFEEHIIPDLDSAQDLVRNANEAVDLALMHKTTPALTTDSPLKNEVIATQQIFINHEQGDTSLAKTITLSLIQPRQSPPTTLHALQEWEGHVLDIGNTDFTARLIDMTAGASYEEEEAVIPLMEISDDDVKKMQIGSIFRWVIGYLHSPSGTKRRVSEFVFRDLPAFTKSDLRNGETWANDIIQSLDL